MNYPTRYRPLGTLFSIPRELDRWMDEALGSMQFGRGENLRNWFPLTDVSETSERLTLKLEVPGLSREDLKISVENNMLTVRGEKRQETASEDENFYRTERSYGAFERSFALPSHVDSEDVKASLQDGILTIRLPRREEARAREISIEGNGQQKRIESQTG
ncbi:MAG TPA: Hsp20/alpha crystallin family protein [Gemmatimonadota bacterium]|nr:Hsp20/alpha crystallin family protein [Gemmatimonadota bacterium]